MPTKVLNQKDILMRAKARAELEYLQENEKYLFYTPNGKVERFIQTIGEGKYFINLMIAGNGVGKTCALVNVVANIVFKNKNLKWFNYPTFTAFPHLKKGRIISDPTTIEEAIVPELHKWFPRGKYQTNKAGRSFDSQWKANGHSWDIMTTEQQAKEFESANLGWCIFDEPCPQDIFKATVARMRRGGIIVVGFTPLMNSAFFYDEYVVHPDTFHY